MIVSLCVQPSELALGWRKLCTVRAPGDGAERDATVYAPLLEEGSATDTAAAAGSSVPAGGSAAARKLAGPELSLQLLTDADIAWRVIGAFAKEPCCCAVVCGGFVTGLACADSGSLSEAYQRATAVYQGTWQLPRAARVSRWSCYAPCSA
jgi:hypothetical protein